jgi:hypothetical protein
VPQPDIHENEWPCRLQVVRVHLPPNDENLNCIRRLADHLERIDDEPFGGVQRFKFPSLSCSVGGLRFCRFTQSETHREVGAFIRRNPVERIGVDAVDGEFRPKCICLLAKQTDLFNFIRTAED